MSHTITPPSLQIHSSSLSLSSLREKPNKPGGQPHAWSVALHSSAQLSLGRDCRAARSSEIVHLPKPTGWAWSDAAQVSLLLPVEEQPTSPLRLKHYRGHCESFFSRTLILTRHDSAEIQDQGSFCVWVGAAVRELFHCEKLCEWFWGRKARPTWCLQTDDAGCVWGVVDGQDENWMFTRLIHSHFLMEIPIELITSSERTSSPRISCFIDRKTVFISSCVVLKLQVRSPYLLMQFGFFPPLFFCSFSHLIMRSYLGFSCRNMSALKRLSGLIWVLITYSFACIKICCYAASSPPVFTLAWSHSVCLPA